jgi:hypothetical protein
MRVPPVDSPRVASTGPPRGGPAPSESLDARRSLSLLWIDQVGTIDGIRSARATCRQRPTALLLEGVLADEAVGATRRSKVPRNAMLTRSRGCRGPVRGDVGLSVGEPRLAAWA